MAAVPSRRSFRLNPQTADEAAVSEDRSELAVFMVTGMCPRCGKYQDSRQKGHLESNKCKSRAEKLLELKLAGLVDFTRDHARFVVAGSNDDHYVVELKDRNSNCECPDHVYRHRFCKHMWLVFMYLGMFEREQRLEWHQAVSATLSELTQLADQNEELCLVDDEQLSDCERLAASTCKAESAAAAATAAEGPRAAIAVVAEHLMTSCTFVAFKSTRDPSSRAALEGHPLRLLKRPPAKRLWQLPKSKRRKSLQTVQVKAEDIKPEHDIKPFVPEEAAASSETSDASPGADEKVPSRQRHAPGNKKKRTLSLDSAAEQGLTAGRQQDATAALKQYTERERLEDERDLQASTAAGLHGRGGPPANKQACKDRVTEASHMMHRQRHHPTVASYTETMLQPAPHKVVVEADMLQRQAEHAGGIASYLQ